MFTYNTAYKVWHKIKCRQLKSNAEYYRTFLKTSTGLQKQ